MSSMKKLFSSLKKKDGPDDSGNQEDSKSIASRTSKTSRHSSKSQNSTSKNEESDLLNELPTGNRDIVGSQRENAPSSSMYTSSSYSDSLFSKSKRTLSTKNSSVSPFDQPRNDIGKPLRVLHTFSKVQEGSEPAKQNDFVMTSEIMEESLSTLLENLSSVIDQLSKSVLDLSKASVKISDSFKNFSTTNNNPSLAINASTNSDLRRIIKIYLHFIDNLLNIPVYNHSKALMLKSFNDFLNKLNVEDDSDATLANIDDAHIPYGPVLQPKVFAIGASERLPNQDKLSSIMEKICQYDSSKLSEQDGSFIAPVLRGIQAKFAVLTIIFGFPEPTSNHKDFTKILFNLYPDIHFMIQKNYIKNCALSKSEMKKPPKVSGFKPPFRIPNDFQQPPISLSLATENSLNLSGTLGGYIYPKISSSDKHLKSYANSVFAITCGHVVLNGSSHQNNSSTESKPNTNPYPFISVPSPVLINLYKKALLNECNKFDENSEERTAYSYVVKQIDEIFPKNETLDKNIPYERFGQIVWGERTIISNPIVSNKVSDLAIIKVNKNVKCLNYLGDDIQFSEFDPSLMFKNLYIKSIVENLDQKQGLPVFKYGSTSKYTKGLFNGPKLLYWADGKIQTSEFIVSSSGANPMFAAGGDSGSWILSKLEDVDKFNNNSNANSTSVKSGLGAVGMLHSYDGEFKQFGLFTSMIDILNRLETVTNTKWGIIGVDENDKSSFDFSADEISSSNDDSDDESGDGYESSDDNLEGANPPEID